jgi:hypothetical protein
MFVSAQQGQDGKGKSSKMKQRMLYVRWLLATSAVSVTNHYLFTSDTNQKDKNICKIIGHLAPLQNTGPCYFAMASLLVGTESSILTEVHFFVLWQCLELI